MSEEIYKMFDDAAEEVTKYVSGIFEAFEIDVDNYKIFYRSKKMVANMMRDIYPEEAEKELKAIEDILGEDFE